jgi:hypothetical protein
MVAESAPRPLLSKALLPEPVDNSAFLPVENSKMVAAKGGCEEGYDALSSWYDQEDCDQLA